MSKLFIIAWTEFRRMFNSPVAWSILAVIQFILAFLFLFFIDTYTVHTAPAFAGREGAPGVTDSIVAPLYLWSGIILLSVMPILTMRQLAEERMNHTFTLLRSASLSMTEVVLGKYFGMLMFVALMVGMITLMPLSLAMGTSLDWGKLFISALGLFLLLASFAAAGLFLSSLTQQPIIAAVSSFGFLLLLMLLFFSGRSQDGGSEVFLYLSHFGHFLSFLEGVFSSGDLVYYLLFISAFLVLTIRKLDNERLQR